MKNQRGPTTIKDVAAVAGVSPSTVSKVLRGSDRISAATATRVLDVVKRLDYRPNAVAQSLRKRSTFTIAMINRDATSEADFALQMMVGVERVARQSGFHVFFGNSGSNPGHERSYIESMLDNQVGGFIFVDSQVRAREAPPLPARSAPHVFLYEYAADGSAPSVIPDDELGGFEGTRHLLAQGRRRVAFVNGDLSFEAARKRKEGYARALREAGLPLDDNLLIDTGSWREEGGYLAAQQLFEGPEPPTAVFFANDYLAIGGLEALKERGLRVPTDVAILGFDDRSAAKHARPTLSTMRLPFEVMGERAGRLVLDMIAGKDVPPEVMKVPCPLIARDSTASSYRSSARTAPGSKAEGAGSL